MASSYVNVLHIDRKSSRVSSLNLFLHKEIPFENGSILCNEGGQLILLLNKKYFLLTFLKSWKKLLESWEAEKGGGSLMQHQWRILGPVLQSSQNVAGTTYKGSGATFILQMPDDYNEAAAREFSNPDWAKTNCRYNCGLQYLRASWHEWTACHLLIGFLLSPAVGLSGQQPIRFRGNNRASIDVYDIDFWQFEGLIPAKVDLQSALKILDLIQVKYVF